MILIAGAGMVAGLVSLSMVIGERNRDRALVATAKRAGLEFSPSDPFDCASPPFDLFRQGDGRGTQNVMWRASSPHPIRVFDYWWFDEYEDENGVKHRTYQRRTCALADVGWMWPQLSLQRENLVSKAASVLGARDIEFESEEFNRTFFVTCEDRKFANAFLDAQMIDLLAATKGLFEMEVHNRWILLYSKRLKGNEMAPLYRLIETLVSRVPRLVYEMWPAR
ncbi:MAG TPA: hypothetical protein VMK16_04520 [Acidimicrobiales bacterium]|nr:hypothetical protein [Acidimicrobiales bacterium]